MRSPPSELSLKYKELLICSSTSVKTSSPNRNIQRWLSHQNAVDALRKCLCAVHVTLQQEATQGEATAYGLCMEIQKPQFIACLLLLSDILAVLGNLSRTFQLAQLNLLTVEQLVKDAKASLIEIKENLFTQGYMADLEESLQAMEVNKHLDTDAFSANARSYVDAIITNLENRFPQVKILSLLGYFDPRNVGSTNATPFHMLELGDWLQIDGHKLWQEYTGYKSFVKSLPEPHCLEVAVKVMYSPANRETLTVAYPLISSILARIAVLPASSAQVERLFSAMHRGSRLVNETV